MYASDARRVSCGLKATCLSAVPPRTSSLTIWKTQYHYKVIGICSLRNNPDWMDCTVSQLSKADIDRLASVLCRRPDYGIAQPSQRWQTRQQEKVATLPKVLLRTKNILKKITLQIVDHIDRQLMPPAAVLCSCHARLNPYLIRNLFLLLAAEVSVHTDRLRALPTKDSTLSDFIDRMDSINAYWMSREVFLKVFGQAPYDNRFVRVLSGCEACILATVGANGRILADLHGQLLSRERRKEKKKSHRRLSKKSKPRLLRVVDSWIGYLDMPSAEQVHKWSAELLKHFTSIQPELRRHRSQVRKHRDVRELIIDHGEFRVRRLSRENRASRRSHAGIPLPATIQGVQSRGGQLSPTYQSFSDVKSIYRADSMLGHDTPLILDPYTKSTHKPSQDTCDHPEISLEGALSGNDSDSELGEQDAEGIPYRSRRKVQDWYSRLLIGSEADMHPAFQYAYSKTDDDAYIPDSPGTEQPSVRTSSPPRQESRSMLGATRTEWIDEPVQSVVDAPDSAGSGERSSSETIIALDPEQQLGRGSAQGISNKAVFGVHPAPSSVYSRCGDRIADVGWNRRPPQDQRGRYILDDLDENHSGVSAASGDKSFRQSGGLNEIAREKNPFVDPHRTTSRGSPSAGGTAKACFSNSRHSSLRRGSCAIASTAPVAVSVGDDDEGASRQDEERGKRRVREGGGDHRSSHHRVTAPSAVGTTISWFISQGRTGSRAE
ncbi:hypothetical protein BX600DRAFT_215464 [Xylariales sp. PMI_506]|nr:hypothetical protein BX600DRAFT_215464 [Xylariales sp. PMI_506]